MRYVWALCLPSQQIHATTCWKGKQTLVTYVAKPNQPNLAKQAEYVKQLHCEANTNEGFRLVHCFRFQVSKPNLSQPKCK